MFGSTWGNSNNAFGNPWKVSNPGIKNKKNPMYELQSNILIKKEDIKDGLREDRYSELVPSDFVGKLLIVYEKDNIGKSGGHPQWCYVYDCNHGKITYIGRAIHKCVDMDCLNQNYNEVLYSVLGNLVFDKTKIRVPRINLIKNNGYEENSPAVLSFSVVQRDDNQDSEEMFIMKTVAFNKVERKDIYDDRIDIQTILDSVKIQVMKKVGYEKKKAIEKIDDEIINLKIAKQTDPSNKEKYDSQEKLITAIKNKVINVNSQTTLESFLKEISEELDREVTHEEVSKIQIKGNSIETLVGQIISISKQKKQNYAELEKSIIQTTVLDLMTNNTDRHLTNWTLIRDKKTDRYILGLFDHATSFYDMGTRNDQISINKEWLSENWASSSVYLNTKKDTKLRSSTGIDVFKYLMTHYKEYTLEMLQNINKSLPEFEKLIGYDTIPNSEYAKLSEDEKKKYYSSDLDLPVIPKKAVDGLKSKFKRIREDFGIAFDNGKIREYVD